MSGGTSSSIREINARATDFLERREFDTWSEMDAAALDMWLAELKAHCAAFWRLEAAWDRTHRLAALKSEQLAAPRPVSRMTSTWLRMAAGAAAIAVVGMATSLTMMWPHDVIYETPIGGRQTIDLADGSQVELNTNTILRARITAQSRSVTLVRGEAYFRIHHDENHPFVVTAAGRRIIDLGTTFTVRNDGSGVSVALFEGKARFEPAEGKPGRRITLTPGDKLVATATHTSVSHNKPQALASDLGWRRGVVIFKRTSLAEVAAEFNRYNEIKLVIADPETARLTVGGTFPANNVELFSRMASNILGLEVSRRGRDIVITR